MATDSRKKRLLIEDDSEISEDTLVGLANEACKLHGIIESGDLRRFFHEVKTDAMFGIAEVYEAVKNADEIYADTALLPNFGTSEGAIVFDNMMYRVAEDKVINKSLYIFRKYDAVDWGSLNGRLINKAFTKNYMYVISDDESSWEQVDIDKLIRDKF
jgi:hypothetical protein